jgi:hypothetical protein
LLAKVLTPLGEHLDLGFLRPQRLRQIGQARFALRYPRRILVVASLFLVAAGLFGAPVSTSVPAGGYDVPRSESARAERILEDKFDASGMSVETKNFTDLEFRCPA